MAEINHSVTHNFNLIVGSENYQLSKLGVVIGIIFFECDEQFFPERNWTDFPIDVLAWWLDELDSGKTTLRLDFMDGPFFLEAKLRGDTVSIIGHRDGNSVRKCKFQAEVSILDFTDTILSAASETKRRFSASDETIEGLDTLSAALSDFKGRAI